MRIQLPEASYGTNSSKNTSVQAEPLPPESVHLWNSFEEEVRTWLKSNKASNDARMITRPFLLQPENFFAIKAEVMGLQPYILVNLIKTAVVLNDFTFSERTHDGVMGADLYTLLGNVVQYVIELKGKWSLDGNLDFSSMFHSEPKNQHNLQMIQQAVTYASLAHCEYAVLTSYENTYFMKILRGKEIKISPSFSLTNNAKSPTLLECFGYFQSIARRTEYTRHTIKRNINPTCIDPSLFDVGASIGQGRAEVYAERTYDLALKLADKVKHRDVAYEVKKEGEIYALLASLQGVCIPKLKWSGTFVGLFEGLGLSPRGKVPSAMTER
jgi:hypothetical protein